MNTIGKFFSDQGGRADNLKAWKSIDQLTAAFPKTVSELKSAQNDEAAAKIVIDLLEQAEQKQICDSPAEHEALLQWLEGLLAVQV